MTDSDFDDKRGVAEEYKAGGLRALLAVLGALALWVALQVWVLPRLGVRT